MITVNVTPESAPELLDFASTVTFGENLVNAAPQILDATVTFTDIEGNFDGGTLVVSGFVSGEDTIAINNEGTGAGQISVDGTNVRYANTVIGTYVGGTGAVGLTVTLNSAAASEAIDALVQNLTYANSSDSPTAARTLTVTITDDAAKTDSVTMTVNVTPEFEAPVANDDTGTATAFSSTSVFSSLDAIVTNDSHANPLGIKEDQIIINDGSGGLTTSIISADAFRASDVKLGDFDGDGDLDALLANSYLLTNQGGAEGGTEGTFVSSQITGGIAYAQGLAVGDIDSDGDLDAFYANWSNTANELFINQGGAQGGTQGQFVISTETAGGGSHSRDVALGDIDGDGDLDAVIANDTSSNQLLINDGTGSFSLSSIAAAVSQTSIVTSDVIIADLNADGYLDVVFANSSGQNELLINNGSGSFFASVLAGGTYNSTAVVSGDLDGDGDLDLIIANNGTANQVLFNQGSPFVSFVASNISGSNGDSTDIALADIDGDGDLDAIITNNGWSSNAEKNQLLINDGSGNFTVSDLAGDGNPSNSIAFGDLDGSGTYAAVESDGLPNVGLDPVRGTVVANDTDPQGAALTYVLDAPIDGLTMYANGAWLFDQTNASYNALTSGQTQNVVAIYTVTNAHGLNDQATLTITVTGTNDAPVISAIAQANVSENYVSSTIEFDPLISTLSGSVLTSEGFSFTSAAGNRFAGPFLYYNQNFADNGLGFAPDGDDFISGNGVRIEKIGGGSFDFEGFLLHGSVRTTDLHITASNGATFDSAVSYGGGGGGANFAGVSQTFDFSTSGQFNNVTFVELNYDAVWQYGPNVYMDNFVVDGREIGTDIAVTFTDADMDDIGHTATVTSTGTSGNTGGLTLDAAALALLVTPGTVTKLAGSSNGDVTLSFSVAATVFDYLTAGETTTLSYSVQIDDQDGAQISQSFDVVVTGNDNITLANAAVLSFDGTDDYVDIGNAAPANSGLGDLSVEAWFYWDGTAPTTTEFLVAKGDAGSTDIGWSMSITAAGDLTMAVNSTGDGTDAGNAIGDISLTSEPIGWLHAAFVFDSDGTNGVLTGYLNGSSANWAVTGADSDGSLALGVSGITNAQSMTIGAVDGVSDGVISGQIEGGIDEVRIWDVARTSTEINNEMNQTLNGSETGLTGLWQLNNNANDASTNSNNGTISGDAMFESQTAASTTSGSIYRALLLAEVLDDKDLTYTINTQPNNGMIELDGAEVIYENHGTPGADSFTIDINDGHQTVTETIDVSVVSGFG